MLKLIFVVGIMFLVLNRLMAILGSVQRGTAPDARGSKLLDVTGTGQNLPSVDHKLIVEAEKGGVLENLKTLCDRMDNFSLPSFVKGARKAMSLAIEAAKAGDEKTINSLSDSGLVQVFQKFAGKFESNSSAEAMRAKVYRVQMFNNKAFITLSMDCPKSRWTFSKHIKQEDPKWYISDISVT